MDAKEGIGIFFCDDDDSTDRREGRESLRTVASYFPGVEQTSFLDMEAVPEPDALAREITEKNLQQVVLVGSRPGLFKSAVSAAMAGAGKDPGRIATVTIPRPGGGHGGRRQILFERLSEVIYGRSYEPQEEARVLQETLVIGGGIAGIQAALEIANAGHKVHVVEQSATIGGHMAMFDKTFPTLDCAACILTPKMVEAGQHPNISLLTFSDVVRTRRTEGGFAVTVRRRPRRVSEEACIGCGTCAEKCPSRVSSEFDHGTALRKAIFMPFPQAVPNKYVIDEKACVYVQSRGNGGGKGKTKCGVCLKLCPVEGCINLDEEPVEVELAVGNIIVATGFQVFDAQRAEQFGYGRHPNVIHSLQFERLVNASGPTGGLLKMQTRNKKGEWVFSGDGDEPRKVAIIHCIGSRDRNFNKHCSRVCCMYSLKFAHLVKEKLPEAEVIQYYIDMRAFGKGYEEFYERVRGEGVRMIRGRAARVDAAGGRLVVRAEEMAAGRLVEDGVDMVILAVGLEPRPDAGVLAGVLGLGRGEGGWFLGEEDGIFLAGVCRGPADIPDTVAQASAAASRAIGRILRGGESRPVVRLPGVKPAPVSLA